MIDASIASSDRLVVEQIHSFDTADAQIQLLLVARERDDRQTSIDCIIKRHNFKFSQRSTDGYSDFFWVANSEFPRSLTRAAANLARSESLWHATRLYVTSARATSHPNRTGHGRGGTSDSGDHFFSTCQICTKSILHSIYSFRKTYVFSSTANVHCLAC